MASFGGKNFIHIDTPTVRGQIDMTDNKAKFVEQLTRNNFETGKQLHKLHKLIWDIKPLNEDEQFEIAGRLFDEIIEKKIKNILLRSRTDNE